MNALNKLKGLDSSLGKANIYWLSIFNIIVQLSFNSLILPFDTIVIALLAILFLFPDLIKSKSLWVLLCLFMGLNLSLNWFKLFDHSFVIFYWLLTVLFSLFISDNSYLHKAACLLLGTVFILGAGLKHLNPNFTSGQVIKLVLVADKRLVSHAGLYGMNKNDFHYNQDILTKIIESDDPDEMFLKRNKYKVPKQVGGLSVLLSYLTLIAEYLIGLLFIVGLILKNDKFNKLKHSVFLSFIVITFYFLPVLPFALILSTMGLTIATYESPKISKYYVISIMFSFLSFLKYELVAF